MGKEVLDNAFKGYNACLFAYGQTGSGKSFSIVGTDTNPGILPRVCESIFQRQEEIKHNTTEAKVEFTVTVGMIEIYNEKVFDLYTNPTKRTKEGLKIRETPSKGVYVGDLTTTEVFSYKQLQKEIDKCTEHRTIGATNMNQTSSRAHTITMISITQVFYSEDGKPKNRLNPVVNIIDLAGSERSEKTGATGDRLQEGCNINKGLMVLGRVISQLAEQAAGKNKGKPIPYRESNLTRILQTALGGNSKTSMIAAISPAADNYEETLGTLRYADQVKKIKNNAVINETPQDKLIRELKDENERLKQLLQNNHGENIKLNEDNLTEDDAKKQLLAQQDILKQMEQSYEERLRIAKTKNAGEVNTYKINTIHLSNLNEDDQLNMKVKLPLIKGTNIVGKPNPMQKPNIPINGLGVVKNHCQIVYDAGIFLIANDDYVRTKVFVNGKQIMTVDKVELFHEDRILFGSYNYFILIDPSKQLNPSYTWEFAAKEVNGDAIKGLADGGVVRDKKEDIEARFKEENETIKAKMQEQLDVIKSQKDNLEKQMQEKLGKVGIAAMGTEELDKLKEQLRKEMIEKKLKLQEEEKELKKAEEEQLRKSQRKKAEEEMKLKSLRDIEEVLMQAIPQLNEVNEMCLQMGRIKYRYEPIITTEITPQGFHISKVSIKAFPDYSEKAFSLLPYNDFSDIYYKIKDKFEEFESNLSQGNVEQQNTESDATVFGISVKEDWTLIGNAYIYLEALGNLLEVKNDTISIIDAKGLKNGIMHYSLIPKYFEEKREQNLLEYNTVNDLDSKRIQVILQIHSLNGLPSKLSGCVYCKYNWIDETVALFETEKTKSKTQNPEINYEYDHSLFLSRYVIDHLYESSLVIKVYGRFAEMQIEQKPNQKADGKAKTDKPKQMERTEQMIPAEERIRKLIEENEK